MGSAPTLELRDLRAGYSTKKGFVRAVDGVSFRLESGEFLGVAGESGCGKSTLAYAVMRLLRDNARIESGQVLFKGTDIAALPEAEVNSLRWTGMAMVFQSAMSALNPVLSVGEQLADAVLAHRAATKADAGIVSTQAQTMLPATPQRTADIFWAEPTPTMAPVMV